MQDDFDDGVWIGLLNEALSCGEDSSGDTAEWHSLPSHMLLTKLNFVGYQVEQHTKQRLVMWLIPKLCSTPILVVYKAFQVMPNHCLLVGGYNL